MITGDLLYRIYQKACQPKKETEKPIRTHYNWMTFG